MRALDNRVDVIESGVSVLNGETLFYFPPSEQRPRYRYAERNRIPSAGCEIPRSAVIHLAFCGCCACRLFIADMA